MAVNPITTKDLTVDFRKLMAIPIGRRTNLFQNNPSLLTIFSPTQLAKAFPDYYKRQLPDVSNFITANIERKLKAAGRGWDQKGGGTTYTALPEYAGETIIPTKSTAVPLVEDQKIELLQAGINVDDLYSTIGEKGILVGDKRVEILKNLSKEKLAEAGFEKFETEEGKSIIRVRSVDEEVERLKKNISEIKPVGSVGSGADLSKQRKKEIVYNAVLQQLKEDGYKAKDIKGVAALIAGQPEQESGYNPRAEHDKDKRTGVPTGYGIYGARLERRDAMFRWLNDNGYNKDDLIGQARYMAHEAATVPGHKKYLDSISDLELTKMAKENPDQFRKVMYDFTVNFESPAVPEAGLENRVRGAVDTFNMKEENIFKVTTIPTKEDIEQERKENLTRTLYENRVITNQYQTIPDTSNQKIKPVEDPLSFMQNRNPRSAKIDNVDPVLLKSYSEGIQQFEADNPDYVVQVFGESSGVRNSGSTRNHGVQPETGHGGAIDLVIIDKKTGKQLTNYNTPYEGQIGTPGQTAPLYAKLHSAASLAQAYYFPESTPITFGGGFVSDNPLDLMHGDITHEKGSLGYSYKTGWTPEMMKSYGITENVAVGDRDKQKALAQKIYGGIDNEGNYTSRLAAVKDENTNTSSFVVAELAPQTVGQTTQKPVNQVKETQEKKQAEKKALSPREQKQAEKITTPAREQEQLSLSVPTKDYQTAMLEKEKSPTPKFRTGGSPFVQDDEDLSVYDKSGNLRWEMNSGEGIYIKSEANQYADDKIQELSDTVRKLSETISPQQQQQQQQPSRQSNVVSSNRTLPDNLAPSSDTRWRNAIAEGHRTPGTQQRAFAMSQFRPVPSHRLGERGSPNIV